MDRPKLTDPKEYAIIKSIYFKDNPRVNNDLDTIEELERQESRFRNSNKNSR